MKGVSSKIYDEDYYLNSNLGSEEFKRYKGKIVHPRIKEFVSLINIKKGMKILDLGCGRGDMAIECARHGAIVVGVDYSTDGIKLAKMALKHQSNAIKRNVSFQVMNAKVLNFNKNYFDAVISFDVFEHLYKDELERVMRNIYRVLKPGGILLVHTETNKIYLDYTHRFWSFPLDLILIKVNNKLFGKNYPSLPLNPRNDLHLAQHVNEPTYGYLNSLFTKFGFNGEIRSQVPYKPNLTWKDWIYNIIVYLYPISNYFPLNLLFATEYICLQRKKIQFES